VRDRLDGDSQRNDDNDSGGREAVPRERGERNRAADRTDQPGGQNETAFRFGNFQVSDTPSNWDYSFRAGIFAGDYSGVAVEKNRAYALWTDARNGRGSGGPTSLQPGRNPICEQSDAFFDSYSAENGGSAAKGNADFTDYLVTPCPTDIKDKTQK